MTTRAIGADHPNTLTAVHNLATVYDEMGRYGDAEALYLKAIEGEWGSLALRRPGW